MSAVRPNASELGQFLNLHEPLKLGEFGSQPGSRDARSLQRADNPAVDGAGQLALEANSRLTNNATGRIADAKSQVTQAAQGQSGQIIDAFAAQLNGPQPFTPAWYLEHPNAWHLTHPYADEFAAATWYALAGLLGAVAAPTDYGYGESVTYEDDVVYMNGEEAGSADDYAEEASELAAAGREDEDVADEFMSLGVFLLVPEGKTDTSMIVHLAVNKDGIIQGTYYHAASDATRPVRGSVDKNTQRVAFTIDDKSDIVIETGL